MAEQNPVPVLELKDITMQFGGVVAVDNLSLQVNQGEIVALIGPNGAGKTTAFNVVTGVYAPTNGQVQFKGQTIAENYPRGKMEKLYAGQNKGDIPEHPAIQPEDVPGQRADTPSPERTVQLPRGAVRNARCTASREGTARTGH